VAVLGASSYTYAEATSDEQLTNWIGAHVRAFEFLQDSVHLVGVTIRSGSCAVSTACYALRKVRVARPPQPHPTTSPPALD